MDSRLNSLAPSARQAYNELLAEQDGLLAEATRFEEGIAELNATLAAAEGELGRNTFKQRALELQVRERPGRGGGVREAGLGWAERLPLRCPPVLSPSQLLTTACETQLETIVSAV